MIRVSSLRHLSQHLCDEQMSTTMSMTAAVTKCRQSSQPQRRTHKAYNDDKDEPTRLTATVCACRRRSSMPSTTWAERPD